MATNEPLEPSMIFRSRTTKASSNVTEQKASSRSLLSSMSLIRTSVISTGVLLFSVAQSMATVNQEHVQPFLRSGSQLANDSNSIVAVAAQGEYARAPPPPQTSRRVQGP